MKYKNVALLQNYSQAESLANTQYELTENRKEPFNSETKQTWKVM